MADDPPQDYPYGGLPIIGPWVGRLGMVRQILLQPCTPSVTMWVNAFFYAGFPKFLWSTLKPGPRDYLDIRRPRSSPAHGKRRKFTFDVQDILSGELADTESPNWAKFLLDPVIAKLLTAEFWFLIAGGASDGALWWTSTAFKYAGCQGASGAYASADAIPGYCTTGGFFTAWAPTGHSIMTNDNAGVTVPAGMSSWGGWSIDVSKDPFTGEPPSGDGFELVKITGVGAEEVVQQRSFKQTDDNAWSAKAVGGLRSNHLGGTYVLRTSSALARPLWCTGGYWNMYGNDPTDGIGPDP